MSLSIHDIVIDNFKGVDHLELHDLPERGVFVISGDNEAGKSTIMDAIHLLIEKKHTAGGKKMEVYQPVGRDVGPRVSLTLSAGPYRLTMTKQWLKSRKAELTVFEPHRENVTGRDADDRFEEILAQNVDQDLLAATFMRQSEVEPALESVGIPSLSRALDEASGGESGGGEEDSVLMSAVDGEYARYFSKTGKEARELAEARTADAAAAEELAHAKAVVQELAGHVRETAAAERERDDAEAALPEAREKLEQRAAELEAAEQVTRRAEEAGVARESAAREVRRAEADLARRTELHEEAAARRRALEEMGSGLEAAEKKAADEQETFDRLDEALKKAEDELKAAETAAREARTREKALRDHARLAELAGRVELIDGRTRAVEKARAALPEHTVRAEDVKAVEDAATEVRIAEEVARQRAAKLLVSGPSGADVAVGGEAVELGGEPAEVPLADGTTLRVGEVTAVFRAGQADDTTDADRLDAARGKLRVLLEELHVADAEEARAALERCERGARELDDARRLLDEALGDDDAGELRADRDRLAAALGEDPAPELDAEAAAAQVDQAEEARVKAAGTRDRAAAERDPWAKRTAATELAELRARLEGARSEAEAADNRLATAEAEQAEEALKEVLAGAQTALTTAEEGLAAAHAKVREADPETAAQLHAAAETKVESLTDRASRATLTISRNEGYINHARGAEEELETARSRKERTGHRLAAVERRAHAVSVLREALQRHRGEARARYARPFAEELAELTGPVFGRDACFELDEDLAVSGRSRDGRTVDVELLSGGAKEQLMILGRLAVARLAGGPGQGLSTPVFVDDALGNTDPDRLERMSTVLSKVGGDGQVFILTCMPSRYDGVAGKVDYPIAQLKRPATLD